MLRGYTEFLRGEGKLSRGNKKWSRKQCGIKCLKIQNNPPLKIKESKKDSWGGGWGTFHGWRIKRGRTLRYPPGARVN